jgi:isopenicillin N synthase-like dioxygenase
MYLNEHGAIVAGSEDSTAGLYIQSRSGRVVRVSLPPTACAFQIGEASQIQSGGLLQATPHAVRPTGRRNSGSCTSMMISRESFAVFMEPEFDTPLDIPTGKTVDDCQDQHHVKLLPGTILPLSSRWRPGRTFGDFHVATVTAFCTSKK